MMAGYVPWLVTPVSHTDIQVHPKHDLIDHTLLTACVCGPTVETIKADDGMITFLTRHHSLSR